MSSIPLNLRDVIDAGSLYVPVDGVKSTPLDDGTYVNSYVFFYLDRDHAERARRERMTAAEVMRMVEVSRGVAEPNDGR